MGLEHETIKIICENNKLFFKAQDGESKPSSFNEMVGILLGYGRDCKGQNVRRLWEFDYIDVDPKYRRQLDEHMKTHNLKVG